jgi:hypothetical protein
VGPGADSRGVRYTITITLNKPPIEEDHHLVRLAGSDKSVLIERMNVDVLCTEQFSERKC